jgi:hypothetical protein
MYPSPKDSNPEEDLMFVYEKLGSCLEDYYLG